MGREPRSQEDADDLDNVMDDGHYAVGGGKRPGRNKASGHQGRSSDSRPLTSGNEAGGQQQFGQGNRPRTGKPPKHQPIH